MLTKCLEKKKLIYYERTISNPFFFKCREKKSLCTTANCKSMTFRFSILLEASVWNRFGNLIFQTNPLTVNFHFKEKGDGEKESILLCHESRAILNLEMPSLAQKFWWINWDKDVFRTLLIKQCCPVYSYFKD